MDEDKNWGTPVDKSDAIGNCMKLVQGGNREIHKLIDGLMANRRLFQLHPVAEIKDLTEHINSFVAVLNNAHNFVLGTTEEDTLERTNTILNMQSMVEKKMRKFMMHDDDDN